MKNKNYLNSIRFKLLVMTIGFQVIVALIFIAVALITSNKMLNDNNIKVSESIEYTVQIAVENWRSSTLAYAKIVAEQPSPVMVEAINNKDTATIVELAKNAFSYTGCNGMTFTDMEGNALARVHNPNSSGDNIKSSLAIADALEGNSVSYVYPTLNSGFSITAGVPIYNGSVQIGVLFLSKRLDTPLTVNEIKRMTDCEVIIYQGNNPVMASYIDDVSSLGELPDDYQATLNSGNSICMIENFEGSSAVWRYTPIEGRNGAIVGSILTIHANIDDNWVIILWIGLFFAVCAIITPIVTFNVKKIVVSLTKSTESLRGVIDNIINAANQFKESSTTLADSSNQQAASIEETSATMSETTSMITQNAESTRQANRLAQKSKDKANDGKNKMHDLVNSMNHLRESSNTISKIIKTIDDIAFQTNLLAINATIEAARAGGEAGRSFAIVAEEVRNLAKRSADAAQNTTDIIEKNIYLTNSGREISYEVADALETVTEEFDNLTQIISEINVASEEQTTGANQINTALSRMEKVTQSNAAISQESASSANMLQQLTDDIRQVYEDINSVIYGK